MKLIKAKGLTLAGCVVTVGNFDGLHLGHQALIQKTQSLARQHGLKSVVLSFDPHPRQVLYPHLSHLRLSSPVCLQQQLEGGVDFLWIEKFTLELARLSPLEFVQYFLKPLTARHVVVGEGFRFAHKRSGDTRVLQQLGQQMGFGVHVLAPVQVEGQVVSSTRVREALQRGDTELCRRLLGRYYSVQGVVLKGRQQARELGFPTLNLKPAHRLACRQGVYAGYVVVSRNEPAPKGLAPAGPLPGGPSTGGQAPGGQAPDSSSPRQACVINYGVKPTFGSASEPLVEAHILQPQVEYAKTIAMESLLSQHKEPSQDKELSQHKEPSQDKELSQDKGLKQMQRPEQKQGQVLKQDFNLYNKWISCYFTHFLRDEKKFASPAELKKQIALDIQQARARSQALT